MTRPTPSSDVLVAHLDGEAVLLHLGSKRYFRLNDTAAAVWRAIETGDDVPAIVDALVKTFDVDRADASRETERVIGELRHNALVVGVE